ncbi:MAG: helix-turn-helix domain-containing protein [Planctomycetota bacterium]
MPKTIHRDEYERVRALLRDLRIEQGVRQTELAAELGTRQSFVSDVERGSRRIDVIELRDWCRALRTDLVSFCEALERGLPPSAAARKRPVPRKPNARKPRARH